MLNNTNRNIEIIITTSSTSNGPAWKSVKTNLREERCARPKPGRKVKKAVREEAGGGVRRTLTPTRPVGDHPKYLTHWILVQTTTATRREAVTQINQAADCP